MSEATTRSPRWSLFRRPDTAGAIYGTIAAMAVIAGAAREPAHGPAHEPTRAAADWERAGRDPGALLRGALLADAREAVHPSPLAGLTASERSYLAASVAHGDYPLPPEVAIAPGNRAKTVPLGFVGPRARLGGDLRRGLGEGPDRDECQSHRGEEIDVAGV